MDLKLHLSASPHIRSKVTTQKIMLDVIIALLPATIAGCVIFGLRSLAVLGVTIGVAVACEALFNLIFKKDQTVLDLSAVLTGLLLGLNLPANLPLWQAAVGSFFAIVVVKMIFGGIGCNFANPAITARVFMLVAFGSMAKAAYPIDSTAGATPLAQIANDEVPALLDLFLGNNGGTIGETCAIALLIGGVYLIARKVITWHIPVAYIGVAFLLTLIVEGGDFNTTLALMLSGGLLLGAFFMATDYVTSPSTALGKIIFGVGAAIITVSVRYWGNYPEGVSLAILAMNLVSPLIDKVTARKLYGGVSK